jgi:hypothetical protein
MMSIVFTAVPVAGRSFRLGTTTDISPGGLSSSEASTILSSGSTIRSEGSLPSDVDWFDALAELAISSS